MKHAFHAAPRAAPEPILLLALPGLNIRPEDFAAHGFVEALHENAPCVDFLVVEPDLDTYLDGTVKTLLGALVSEKRAQGYARVWLAGISLGGFGALLAARAEPNAVEGAILLSPFLGTPGLIAEVERAGGLAAWEPGEIAADDGERRVLAWLRLHVQANLESPVLHLGYGANDRFAVSAALLGACLRPSQLCVVDGGHDWSTWTLLWRNILAKQPFTRAKSSNR